MARYGQQLLRRLTFQFCDLQGSSRGMREYIETSLPHFAARNPAVIVRTVNKRNRFPLVTAEYGMLPGSASQLQAQLARQAEQQLQRHAYGALKQQRPRTAPPPPLHGRLLCRELPDGRRLWGRLHFVGASDAHRPYVAVFEDGSQHSHDDASVEPHLQPQDARPPPGVTLPAPFSAASTWQPALNRNVIGLKHASGADIRSVVWWLSQSQCRSTRARIPAKRIRSKQPSIQGAWSATTF